MSLADVVLPGKGMGYKCEGKCVIAGGYFVLGPGDLNRR